MVNYEQLASKIRAIANCIWLGEKRMFGGMAFILTGNICFGADKNNLMVCTGLCGYDEVLTFPDARLMDIIYKPMKGFGFVKQQGLSKDAP